MKIIEALKKCSFETIKSKITLHYGSNDLDEYEKLYYKLIDIELNSKNASRENFYVFICAFVENDDEEYVLIEKFNENDTSLYFDVCSRKIGEDIIYSISAARYFDFIRYEIDEKTLKNFSLETILAHCLWEVTAYGFEDNDSEFI